MDTALHRWRILVLVLGFLLLFWLPVEDLNASWVTLFAAAICSLAAARILISMRRRPGRKGWLVYSLSGTIAGAAIALVSLLLMAFKSGLHGHGSPDFTPDQVITILRLTPLWALAGFLIGLGVGIWLQART